MHVRLLIGAGVILTSALGCAAEYDGRRSSEKSDALFGADDDGELSAKCDSAHGGTMWDAEQKARCVKGKDREKAKPWPVQPGWTPK